MYALRSVSLSSGLRLAARQYATAAEGAVKLTFASSAQTFYNNANVFQVNVPASDGEMGILANHVPTLAVLRPGVVSVTEAAGGAAKEFFVSSGTVTINDDATVQVVAEEAAPLTDFDVSKASAGLDEWTKKQASAKTDVEKAEADIGFEVYRALTAALGAAKH